MRSTVTFGFATIFCWISAQLVGTAAEPDKSPRIIVDFQQRDFLARADAGPGVTMAITNTGEATSRRALEIKIAPFSVHKNQWPSVALGPKYFTSPIDVSGYSRLEVTVRKLTPGFGRIHWTFSSLPYNNGGRNLEGELCPIPGEAATTARVNISALQQNDPSTLRLMYLTFPPNERSDVYRIEAVRAVHDPIEHSPAEKLADAAETLQTQFEQTAAKTDWSAIAPEQQNALRQEISTLRRQIQSLVQVCRQGAREGLHGQYRARKKELADLSDHSGRLFLADKKDFVLWRIDPYLNIIRGEAPGAGTALLDRIEMPVAQGEFRDQVFMVSPCDKEVRLDIKIASDDLPQDSLKLFETVYLKDHLGQETGDAVAVLQGPLVIPAGESRQIRLRFDTRYASLPPGRHTFRVTIRDASTAIEKVVPGTLEVWPIQLPSYDVLRNNCYTEFDSSEFYEGQPLAKAVAHMKMYGLNVVYVHPVEMPQPKEVDAEGRILRYDDTLFEKRVSQILKAWNEAPGKETFLFIFTISSMYEPMPNRTDLTFNSPRWHQVMTQWLAHLHETTRKLGVADRQWMVVMGDESSESALVSREIPMAEAVKRIDPTIRTTCNTSTIVNDPGMSRRFFQAFDVLQPELNSFKTNAALRDWLKQGHRPLWTYQCTGGMAGRGKNVYAYYRVYGWDLVKYGLTGTGLWTYCAQAQSQAGGGYLLVHRRGNDVIHSRRYEMFREGLDDYRYIQALRDLAREKGPEIAASAEKFIQQAVDDVTSHAEDTRRCETWRVKIADEILRIGK